MEGGVFNFNFIYIMYFNKLYFNLCRKFDIGIYTLITSVDPLIVYIYEEEILLRHGNVFLFLFYSKYNSIPQILLQELFAL